MKTLSAIAIGLMIAMPAGAQQAAEPMTKAAASAAVPAPMAAASDAEAAQTATVNQTAAAAVSAQTLTIQQAMQTNARQQQEYAVRQEAFRIAQAEYERKLKINEAEQAAAAVAAAEYKRNFAAWQAAVGHKDGKQVAAQTMRKQPGDITATANIPAIETKRVCTMEGTTGSLIASRKVCRTVAEIKEREVATNQEKDAMRSAMGRGFTFNPMAPQ